LWTLLFALCAAGPGLAGAVQSAAGDPLRIVPADALYCVRISKLTNSLAQMDQFLTGVSPFGVSMLIQSQLGQFLGQPEPAGINLAGDIAIFGPLPGGEKPQPQRVGLLVPLSDFQQFLTNPNVAKPDARGILQIGPEGKKSLAGVQMGSYLLLTRAADQQALTEAKNWTAGGGAASLAARLSPDELKRATGAPAWAYFNVQIANKLYGPMIQQKIKEGQAKFQQMQAKDQPLPFQPQRMMEAYASMAQSFLQEAQSASLTLEPSASALRLSLGLAAVPNTEMAKMLSADSSQQQTPDLFGYLDNGAAMNGVLSLSPALLKTLMTKYTDLLTAMFEGMDDKEDVGKFRQLMMDSVEALAGSLAWSMSIDAKSKPPFAVKYVATLKDPQKFYQVLEQSSKMMAEGAFADLYKKLGLKMQFDLKRKVETYKDVPIDSIRFTIQPVEGAAPTPQTQMMGMMFGEGFDIRLAIVNNLLVYAFAPDPQKAIHTLIDQAKAGGPAQMASEVQTALNLLPEAKKSEFFITYNILRLMQMGMAFAPMSMPAMDVPTQNSLALAGDIGGGRLQISAALPKQHLLELMAAFMKMQQQKMQQSKPPQKEPGQDS
jgi:hypothetical protein